MKSGTGVPAVNHAQDARARFVMVFKKSADRVCCCDAAPQIIRRNKKKQTFDGTK